MDTELIENQTNNYSAKQQETVDRCYSMQGTTSFLAGQSVFDTIIDQKIRNLTDWEQGLSRKYTGVGQLYMRSSLYRSVFFGGSPLHIFRYATSVGTGV